MLNVRVTAEPSALEDSPDGPVLNIRLSMQVPVLDLLGLLGQLQPQQQERQQPVLQQQQPGFEPRQQPQQQQQAARPTLLQPRSERIPSSWRTSRSPPRRRRESYSPQPAWSPGPDVRRRTEQGDGGRFAFALARLEQQALAEARWPERVPTPEWGQQPQQQQQPWEQPWQQQQPWYDQQQQQLHDPHQQQQQHSSWTRHRTGQLLQYGRPFHLQ